MIRQLNDSMGLTSLFVSHEIEETFEIADHVILLADGKVIAEGSPEQMRGSTDELVHQYVNSLPEGPVGFHYPRVPIEQELGLAAGQQTSLMSSANSDEMHPTAKHPSHLTGTCRGHINSAICQK